MVNCQFVIFLNVDIYLSVYFVYFIYNYISQCNIYVYFIWMCIDLYLYFWFK